MIAPGAHVYIRDSYRILLNRSVPSPRDVNCIIVIVATDLQFDASSNRCFLEEPSQLPHADDVFLVELKDDIAFFQAGFRRRTVWLNTVDHHAAVFLLFNRYSDPA